MTTEAQYHSFNWQNEQDGIVIITQGDASLREILRELTRFAIHLSSTVSPVDIATNRVFPSNEELPNDEDLEPLFTHLAFTPDGQTVFSTGGQSQVGTPLIDIDYFGALSVKLVVDLLEPGSMRFCSRLFDWNHQPKAALRVLHLAAFALDSRDSNNSHS